MLEVDAVTATGISADKRSLGFALVDRCAAADDTSASCVTVWMKSRSARLDVPLDARSSSRMFPQRSNSMSTGPDAHGSMSEGPTSTSAQIQNRSNVEASTILAPPFVDLLELLLGIDDDNDRGHRRRRSEMTASALRNRPACTDSKPRASASFRRASSSSLSASSGSAKHSSTSPSGSPGGASPEMRPFSTRTRIAFIPQE